ncbi:protein CHROMATIN REMODELING 24 [Abeliophyllum distichum]|uniref:Protein CHROMATIN REMODELING 24 n=1 Tax=Abeliophyllum distichum TaxID=126358 RepID=A0ABD1RV47_9LAMI
MKVKIEGRRRLCKICKSKNYDNEGKTLIENEEPTFIGISNFDSSPQVKTACESTGNEIRDILNDLSSRLELLSVEKRSVWVLILTMLSLFGLGVIFFACRAARQVHY